MNDQDRQVLRHLAGHFGTRAFTTKEAEASAGASGDSKDLPGDAAGWGESLKRMAEKELVVAETEGWRLVATALEAAGILNI